MPKRTNRRRGNNTTAPPPVIKVTPVKLDAGLTIAYEWMAADAALGLRLASDWYAANTAKLLRLNPITAADSARQSHYAKAIKTKSLGDNAGATEHERATAWQMALRLYEKAFPGMSLMTLAEGEKAAVEAPTTRIKNVKVVLDNLNAAFGPLGIRYAPRATDERDFSEGTIWVPQVELEQMVATPPLKLALAEAATVAQALSVRVVNAQQEIDIAALLTNVPLVMNSLYAWAETMANGSLVKPVGRPAKTKQSGPRTPRAPRQPFVPTPGGSNYAPKPGSKMEIILNMCKLPGGSSIKDMSAAVHFQAGAAINHLRQKGLNIQKLANGNFQLV